MPIRVVPWTPAAALQRAQVALLRLLRQAICPHPIWEAERGTRMGLGAYGEAVVTQRCPRCHARRVRYEGRP